MAALLRWQPLRLQSKRSGLVSEQVTHLMPWTQLCWSMPTTLLNASSVALTGAARSTQRAVHPLAHLRYSRRPWDVMWSYASQPLR